MSTFRLLSAAASDNAALAVAGRAMLRTVIGTNKATADRWLKIYDKRTVPVVADTPDLTIHLPASTSFALGIEHLVKNGCGFRLTTGAADNDAGALTAGDIVGLNFVLAD